MIGKWIVRRWRQTQRNIDLKILWPQCKAAADEVYCEKDQALAMARQAFRWHCVNDEAWTKDMTNLEISASVEKLV